MIEIEIQFIKVLSFFFHFPSCKYGVTMSVKFLPEVVIQTQFRLIKLVIGNAFDTSFHPGKDYLERLKIIESIIFQLSLINAALFDKLQSRKSQGGTQVQISDLELSLETHFPPTHPPIHPTIQPVCFANRLCRALRDPKGERKLWVLKSLSNLTQSFKKYENAQKVSFCTQNGQNDPSKPPK